MRSNIIMDASWAVLLLIIAPYRALIKGIYNLFVCKSKRPMEQEIVLVTGAARGLGRGMALEFAKLGATVVCWDINEYGCQETAELAKKISNGRTASYVCDINNRDEVAQVARRVQDDVGQVTILVNNAGIVSARQLNKYKPEEISQLVCTNFTSHFWTIEAFLPHMKSVNGGQIVCISSMSSLTPTEYLVPYSATKCAVTGLMDALDEELVSLGYNNIKLTTIYPHFTGTHGLIETMKKNNRAENGPSVMNTSKVVKEIVDGVVAKRREFSIPSYLLTGTRIVKFYPRYVTRAFKKLLLKNWKTLFVNEKNPVQSH